MKNNLDLLKEFWHKHSIAKTFELLESSQSGLSEEEVAERRKHYGLNKLPYKNRISLFRIILHQVVNPLIFILIAAGIASILIGEAEDAIFIFLVITINSSLGAYQEFNAEKSAQGLQKLLKIKARIIRGGKELEVDSESLVPGDYVLLESGAKVPADLRLTQVHNIEIDESFLTGESLAVRKQVKELQQDKTVADRINLAFAGSTVMTGRGEGVVIGTGINTQVGVIASNVAEGESAKPPLMLRMERFIWQITIFILVLSLVLAVVLNSQGMELSAIFFLVVALAVSAIPEGLPVALTVALSIATKRMARRNVIVRKLTSVESLGSCTEIASDKTGTLTVNQQTVKKIVLNNEAEIEVTGEGYNGEGELQGTSTHPEFASVLDALFRVSVLANEASLQKKNQRWEHFGDAMDIALLGMVYKSGTNPDAIKNSCPVLGLIPYESENKFSAAFYRNHSKVMVGAKGALETILDFCHLDEHQPQRITITTKADSLASQGYRVLAFAEGELKSGADKSSYNPEDVPQLGFIGLICFIDPLRPEAKEAVSKCRTAGIKVLMITGDHPETARNIAMELGISAEGHPVVTGKMLTKLNDDKPAFEELVLSSRVFARVTPMQKLEIVDVAIRNGEFVAVTGDGVNDAPALKRANIGVAMGSGTDVAKDVGSMIIMDDNFSSIVAGIEEGRFAYDNVRKVIYLLVSTGAGLVMMFILAIMLGMPLPLLAVQLLWLNLVTNGIQDVALAFEGGEPGAMEKMPRKPSEGIFNPLMIKQSIVSGSIMAVITFSFWYYLIYELRMEEFDARNLVLLLMVFMQNFHVFNCRSETVSAFKVPLSRNYILIFGVLIAQGIHILSMHLPTMQRMLKIQPISLHHWLMILSLAIPVLLGMELFKWVYRKYNATTL
jgi:magnesium-transporting ATPase (P-type)